MSTSPRVALISHDASARRKLSDYLGTAGFEVEECDEHALPATYAAVVMVAEDDAAPDALEAQIRSWIKLGKVQRVVVVTSRPAALRALVLVHATRLSVLAAPVFAWDVVDALRAGGPGLLPRGA